ncbi:hypothetical protein WJX81_002051 [Elliptochloris bilobata]|uniref:CS domain-containing protein n=1 Tax=Elliptochloris bilobata TaxID=381761 RepID=A0AAW1SCI7_9CHLO
MSCVIEEVDLASDPTRYEDALERILVESGRDATKFLAAVFAILHSKTNFFSQPDASKVLARLLRDVKKAAAPGKGVSSGFFGAAAAEPAVKHASAAAAAPEPLEPAAHTNATSQVRDEPASATPSTPESEEPAAADDDMPASEGVAEPEEDKSKGLKPNAGNGADLERYSWVQTLGDVVVSVPVPPGTKGRQCAVDIKKGSLSVGVAGAPPLLAGELWAPVQAEECFWNVDGRALEVTLQKVDRMAWWRAVVKGEPEIDTQRVEPESSKLSDLDGETRQTVEKMMWDQRQKALGLPTSEEASKQAMLQKFMAAHPEMDFSKAKMM